MNHSGQALSLHLRPPGSKYVFTAPWSTRGTCHTPRHMHSACEGAESSPSPTLSWDLRNKGCPVLLCLPHA